MVTLICLPVALGNMLKPTNRAKMKFGTGTILLYYSFSFLNLNNLDKFLLQVYFSQQLKQPDEIYVFFVSRYIVFKQLIFHYLYILYPI